jgi:saccharopine dehydrogenase-like NADP-dependent oxidoreductase
MNRDVNDVSGTQYGGFQFGILGKKNGQAAQLILGYYDSCYHMTEVACAFAAEQLVKGLIPQKGIVIPEAVDPIPFLEMAKKEGVVLQGTFEDVP